MFIFKLVLILGIAVIIYSYFGYAILLFIILKIRRFFKGYRVIPEGFVPPVTLVVAAFNEQDFIKEKIANTLALNYPQDKLNIIFVTDGSTDHTPEILNSYTRIKCLHRPERAGKVAAMHRAMDHVQTDFVIFSDANTILNKDCLKNIVRHYQDEKVGGVAGEKKIINHSNHNVAGAGEGLYWKYESFLKKLDSEFFTVVGAAGELFSIRTSLYTHPGKNVILDDLIISLNICLKGYRIVYEPESFACETPSSNIKEEGKRKIRISAGAFQSMIMLKDLLNVFKHPKLSFQYISHRVLRWTLCPLFLPLIFIVNLFLFLQKAGVIYSLLLMAQVLFYLAALIGWVLHQKNIRNRIFYPFYYFFFINFSLYQGFIRFMRGNQTVLWEKANRKQFEDEKPEKNRI